jgi:hypothetical protein
MKKIFRVAEKAPPLSPSPYRVVQGVGKHWLFSATSRGFDYGFEAVRIRVKLLYSKYELEKLYCKLL